jgi:hypothetical protein
MLTGYYMGMLRGHGVWSLKLVSSNHQLPHMIRRVEGNNELGPVRNTVCL